MDDQANNGFILLSVIKLVNWKLSDSYFLQKILYYLLLIIFPPIPLQRLDVAGLGGSFAF